MTDTSDKIHGKIEDYIVNGALIESSINKDYNLRDQLRKWNWKIKIISRTVFLVTPKKPFEDQKEYYDSLKKIAELKSVKSIQPNK